MRTSTAAAGSTAFFVVAPGTVVGAVPWLITRWEIPGSTRAWRVAQVLGVLLIVVGLIPVVHAFAQFAKAGGTPMPLAPTQRLVVNGFNRYVRNPMYVGLRIVILRQRCCSAAWAWCCTPSVCGSLPRHSFAGMKNPPWPEPMGANTRYIDAMCRPGFPAGMRGHPALRGGHVMTEIGDRP